MILRFVLQMTLFAAVLGAVLFGAAGTWRWWGGWAFLAELVVLSTAISLWLAKHDPGLLAERMGGINQRGQQRWDMIFMLVMMAVFLAWLALMGFDARRFAWSHVPMAVRVAGAVAFAAGMAIVWWTFSANSFAAPVVKVQAERGQTVIDTGPYAFVRHPMYAGALLFFLGAPLICGSWWGLLILPVAALGIGWRAVGEEKMLREALRGYDAYAAKVRYRFAPGVW